MIQRNTGQHPVSRVQESRRSLRPALQDRWGKNCCFRQLCVQECIRLGKFRQMLRKLSLQEATKSKSGWKGLLCLPQRKQAIRVHHFHEHRDLPSLRGDHAGNKKAGELIGHHYAGVRCQSGEQAFACIWYGLQVRIVENFRALEPAGILCHSIECETVHPIACPGIPAAQRFQDNQRLLAASPSTPLLGPRQNSRSPCWKQSSSREQNLHLAGLARSCRS